jgi:hypothetical protein
MTRADQIAEAANERVAAWPSLNRTPGSILKCESVGEAFPVWRRDMGAVRRLLAERDLLHADLTAAA